VGLGFVVVEAACNGTQNLDDRLQAGERGHWPFGDQPLGSDHLWRGRFSRRFVHARSRLYYSNYGSRVDLQGWGEHVFTTGFTNFSILKAPTVYGEFSGTSSGRPWWPACVLVNPPTRPAAHVLSPAE